MAALPVVLQLPQRNKQKLWAGKAAGARHRNSAVAPGLSQGQGTRSGPQSQGWNLGCHSSHHQVKALPP